MNTDHIECNHVDGEDGKQCPHCKSWLKRFGDKLKAVSKEAAQGLGNAIGEEKFGE
jgi:hypothetical protein